METLRVRLRPDEYEALAALCDEELRPLHDHVYYLIRKALRERGLLTEKAPVVPATEASQTTH